jgi:hypothetical protein
VRRSTCRALSLVAVPFLALAGCASYGGEGIVSVPPDVPHASTLRDAAVADSGARDDTPAPRTTLAPPVSPSMLALADGERVAVSDPDTDRLYVVRLDERRVVLAIDLPRGVEPGRLVEDGRGRVHAVLRRGGGIATLEPGASIVARRDVCAAPRGIGYRASDDMLIVACAEGIVAFLPASGGPAVRRLVLDDDLRDVVVLRDRVLVSRFRSAEVLALDESGTVVARYRPATVERVDVLAPRPDPSAPAVATFEPEVAWRMVRVGTGAWLLHQRARTTAIHETARGISYGPAAPDPTSDCAFGMVESALSVIGSDQPSGTLAPSRPLTTVLATDIAVGPTSPLRVPSDETEPPVELDDSPCAAQPADTLAGAGGAVTYSTGHGLLHASGHPLAVTWASAEGLASVELAREPGFTDADIGRSVFQTVQPSHIACMSCHPEGGDDGHVWRQGGGLALRTQTMQGGILATAPYHWEGDVPDFAALVDEVLIGRMRGSLLHPATTTAFAHWVDGLEVAPRPDVDVAAAARGRALFESAEHECSTCHRGPSFSTGDTVDVGTGGAFQVPSLVGVVYRAPYMHSGCAATLRDRFTAGPECNGGDDHGHVSDLTQVEIDDLVAYLRTL